MDTAADNIEDMTVGCRDDFNPSLVRILAIFLCLLACDYLVITQKYIIGTAEVVVMATDVNDLSVLQPLSAEDVHSVPIAGVVGGKQVALSHRASS